MSKKQEQPRRRSLNDRIDAAIASTDDIVVAGISNESPQQPAPNRVGESTTTPAAPEPSSATTPDTPAPVSVPGGLPALDTVPPAETAAPAPAKPALPPAKTIISFVPFEIDTKLAILSSQERISKKRIVLEALLDYLFKRGLLTEEERQQWLLLPKEFGTKQ